MTKSNFPILSQKPVNPCQQGQLIEIDITDLADTGDGIGRFEQLVVFVPDTVPGDRVAVRLQQVKSTYATAKLETLIKLSEHRIRPNCIVADKCGGCQWQHVNYDYQLKTKQNQVIQALERIGGFSDLPCDEILAGKIDNFPQFLGYRNKATYPLARSVAGQVQAGYYQKGTHKLVNLNQCPVQDPRLDPLLKDVKEDIHWMKWPVYDEKEHTGEVRHLSLRIGRRTGEILLTVIARTGDLPGLETQASDWLKSYPKLVGVCLNINAAKTNVIFGSETRCIAGRPFLREEFAGLEFQLRANTFFQVNTEAAEGLLQVIAAELNLQGNEILVDAYCGIGTFTLPLAKQVQIAIGLEVQPEAIAQAELNAQLNDLTNVTFHVGTVEELLPQLGLKPDIVLLDPPRKGCDRTVLETIKEMQPNRIVYVSCKPATLARDLKFLCENGDYKLVRVQPADFFPQTSHVECVAFLVKQ
ncbi:MAG: 23S rRNA (uracil(1939)-C(5))-methyltransferase RlmD [Tychonema bourrellyi B0820]|uniref:23S rRNA (Uracil(1939)-C(5))-methyltransferase RlmD n=1 Tax=Tychonema bourrellyi FEM_GT703 TaxID=2040638 RepID=A0A2G4F2I3_9CYAN|nr:23S rRNA (uracil(1939)-C(5))-methyltransferase RlmD [Tychonema bourrellyi]MDQ2097290.1 23S rRNA (uracil(1939)-C(5))-methyltransferase RlmD [Tychonema bourrellyi B0820]PHX55971.1 23S rRNA (uracil(1939)-C(5))-methyltransferase RlmD [Tychonema bourrellyi FEM_GT703]